jgi:hypothetical protein
VRCVTSFDFRGWDEPNREATVSRARKCSLDSCADPVVTCFAQRDLCLHHFLSRCYEDLDRFALSGRGSQVDSASAALMAFVEECSRRALEVSLQCPHLDNLQRGRLLDILLRASELLPEASAVRSIASSRS